MAGENNPYYVAPVNPMQALMAGEQGYKDVSGAMNDREIKAGRQEAMQALQTGDDLRSPLAKLIGVGDIKGAEAIAAFAKSHYENQGVFGTPIYGTKPDGSTGIGTFDKSGKFRAIDTGGFSPTPGVKVLDTGTGFVGVNSKSGAAVPLGGGSGQPQMPGQQPQGQQIPPTGQPVPQGGGQPMSQALPGQPAGVIQKDVTGEAAAKRLGADTGEKQATMGHAKAALDTSISNLERMQFEADRIMKDPAIARITGLPGVFPNWPGGQAANVQAKLEALKSQVGFGVLQAMRDASKTGGALGQVSDFENRTLQNNLAALDRAQSPEAFKAAMKQIVDWAEGAKGRLQQAYNTDYAGIQRPGQPNLPGAGPAAPAAPKVGEARDGYRYKGGNPADPSSWIQMK